MMLRLRQCFPLALTSALALSACAGNTGPAMPGVSVLSRSASGATQNAWEPGIANVNRLPSETCPKRYAACVTIPKSGDSGLVWCYGPKSDPCSNSNAGKVKWSGVVCLATGPTCKGPIKQLTASWSGPFKCKSSDECEGTYELDTLKPGAGIKVSPKYIYKQHVEICPKADACKNEYIGIAVKS